MANEKQPQMIMPRLALRIILLVMAVSFMATITDGQQAAKKKEEKKPSLEIKLRTLTPTACLGSTLKLEVEVTNTGDEAVKLNRKYFWNSYSFCPLAPQEKGQGRECFIENFWPSSTAEDIFYLAPGLTRIETTDWSLDEENLSAGEYTLELWIYATKQEVQVELYDCGLKEIKEQK